MKGVEGSGLATVKIALAQDTAEKEQELMTDEETQVVTQKRINLTRLDILSTVKSSLSWRNTWDACT